MHTCREHAIDIDWEIEIPVFTERMVEYAYGATNGKEKKTGFLNFLIGITPDCDCSPFSDTPIVPDIGILASKDPVAIGAASFDLVNKRLGLAESLLSAPIRPVKINLKVCMSRPMEPPDKLRRIDRYGKPFLFPY